MTLQELDAPTGAGALFSLATWARKIQDPRVQTLKTQATEIAKERVA